MSNTNRGKVPSGTVSRCRRLVTVFLVTASFSDGDTKAASVAVGSGLRLPTVATRKEVATDQEWGEHARRQQYLTDAAHDEHHRERRLSADVLRLDTTTECMEGQSFTVYSRERPDLSGCYSESGIGRTAVGQYGYFLFGDATDDIATDTPAVVALHVPEIPRRIHWVLGTALEPNPDDNAVYCMTHGVADRSHHPADGFWACQFSEAGTEAVNPGANDFNVSCGCSGPPRTKYDIMARFKEEKRKNGQPMKNVPHNDMQILANVKSNGVKLRVVFVLLAGVIFVAVRVDAMRRDNRRRRLQSSIRDEAGDPGIELPENISQKFPLQSAGRHVVEIEQ